MLALLALLSSWIRPVLSDPRAAVTSVLGGLALVARTGGLFLQSLVMRNHPRRDPDQDE